MVRMAPLHLALFTRNPMYYRQVYCLPGKKYSEKFVGYSSVWIWKFNAYEIGRQYTYCLVSPLHAFKHNPSYSRLKLWRLFIFVLSKLHRETIICIITYSRPNWVLPYLIFIERSIRRVYLNQFSSAFYLNCDQSKSTNKCAKSQ